MAKMKAAVVTSFDEPPHYQPFDVPTPAGAEQVVVDVLAVGLHPRVRTGARGAHYTSSGTLPMIPGIDGVGRRSDGKRLFFVADDDVIGTMAERALIDPRRSLELPDGADAAKIAAAMNPAMSSWVALRRRVPIQAGQSAGPTIELPSVALRSANLRLRGNGQGAVSPGAYLAELPSLVAEIDAGNLAVTANPAPLAEVERVWLEPDAPGERTVLVP